MRYNRMFLTAAVCVIPAVVPAQRGGGRGGGGGGGAARIPPAAARLRLPSRDDIEDFAPAKFLRDKRKKLQLGDADVDALKAAEAAAKERNTVVLAAYDSVRREMQKLADAPEIGSNVNDAVLRRMAFSNLMGQVREQRVADRAEALAAIPADKRQEADALLKDQDEAFDREIGRAGRGGRGGA